MKKYILITLLMIGAVSYVTAQGPAAKSSNTADPALSHWSAAVQLGPAYQSGLDFNAGVSGEYSINPLVGIGLDANYLLNLKAVDVTGYGSLNLSNLCSPFRTGFWAKTNIYALAGGGLRMASAKSLLIMAGLNGEYNLNNALALKVGAEAQMTSSKGIIANVGLRYKFGAATKAHARNIAMSVFHPQPVQTITRQTVWVDCCDDAEKRLVALDKSNAAIAQSLQATQDKIKAYKDLIAAQEAAKAATKAVSKPAPVAPPVVTPPVVTPPAPVVAPVVPEKPATPAPPQLKVANVVTGTMNPVEFQTGSSTLTADSKLILDEMASILLKKEWKSMKIIGNTDNTGDPTINKTLSLKRANIVKAYLVSKGLSAEKLTTSGAGGTNPIDSNKTALGRRLNRRIDFELTSN